MGSGGGECVQATGSCDLRIRRFAWKANRFRSTKTVINLIFCIFCIKQAIFIYKNSNGRMIITVECTPLCIIFAIIEKFISWRIDFNH